MKKRILKIGLGLVFLLVLALGVETAATILYPMNDITKNWFHFYRQEKNSIDLMIMGSSHAYSSFDPALFEEETGKKTYILASNSQNITQTYYNLKEVLKYQKPETVLVEAFGMDNNNNWQNTSDESFDKNWKKESNIDGMRWGLEKIEAICNQYTFADWPYAALKISRTHQNWTSVEQITANYDFYRQGFAEFSCFHPSESSMSEEVQEQYKNMKVQKAEFQISEGNREHFHKLAGLCREHGITLYLVMAPLYDEYVKNVNYESRYQLLSSLAEEENVEYLDCNYYYDEIGLRAEDFEDLYSSYHHLNRDGAEKVSEFLLRGWYEKDNM